MVKKLERITLTKMTLLKENDAGRITSLNWNVNNGFPRIVVFINGPDRSVSGKDNMITAPFTFQGLNSLLGTMKSIIAAPNDTKYELQCFNTKWVDNKRTDDTMLQATVTVGKDANGINYIMLSADGKPDVRFDLNTPDKWFKLHLNGKDISASSQGSKVYTSSYVKQLEIIFGNIATAENEKQKLDEFGKAITVPETSVKTPVVQTNNTTTPPTNTLSALDI